MAAFGARGPPTFAADNSVFCRRFRFERVLFCNGCYRAEKRTVSSRPNSGRSFTFGLHIRLVVAEGLPRRRSAARPRCEERKIHRHY
jgi:hypothetical protein